MCLHGPFRATDGIAVRALNIEPASCSMPTGRFKPIHSMLRAHSVVGWRAEA